MQTFEPQDPNFEAKVRASFARQGLMTNLGARMLTVRPGEVGDAYIHVHHRVPLSEIREEYVVDPVRDLVPGP